MADPKPQRLKSSVAPAEYLAGETIAEKYRLVRVIGEGGMGSVWVARNIALDVHVAIKLIKRDTKAPAAADRLLQEARAAARLGHPAIVRIFDFGQTARGDPFIVMELLEGESLADLLEKQQRMTAIAAVQTLLPICDALATAHQKGIVHRDLKPDNVFLARDEAGRTQPKIVDFGIAKLGEERGRQNITQAGVLLGSPEYMSPEQARGEKDVDQRADVWAFTVVLYEAITGQPPFMADNYNALLRMIVEEDPEPTVSHAAGDEELWLIISRGLRKQRQGRWPGMRELGRALALWLYGRGTKEDLSGASLRAHWLDPAGVLTLPESDVPPGEHSSVSRMSVTRADPAPAADELTPAEVPEPSGPRSAAAAAVAVPESARLQSRPDELPLVRRRAPAILAAAAGLVALIAIVLWARGGAAPAASPSATVAAAVVPSPAPPPRSEAPAAAVPAEPSQAAPAPPVTTASAKAKPARLWPIGKRSGGPAGKKPLPLPTQPNF